MGANWANFLRGTGKHYYLEKTWTAPIIFVGPRTGPNKPIFTISVSSAAQTTLNNPQNTFRFKSRSEESEPCQSFQLTRAKIKWKNIPDEKKKVNKYSKHHMRNQWKFVTQKLSAINNIQVLLIIAIKEKRPSFEPQSAMWIITNPKTTTAWLEGLKFQRTKIEQNITKWTNHPKKKRILTTVGNRSDYLNTYNM